MKYLIIVLLGVFGFQSLFATGVQNGDFDDITPFKWDRLGATLLLADDDPGMNDTIIKLGPGIAWPGAPTSTIEVRQNMFQCGSKDINYICEFSFSYKWHPEDSDYNERFQVWVGEDYELKRIELDKTSPQIEWKHMTILDNKTGCNTTGINFKLKKNNLTPDGFDAEDFKSSAFVDNVKCECIPKGNADCNGNGILDFDEIAQDETLDLDQDGYLDSCFIETTNVPTLSQWGLIILTLLLLTMASVGIVRQRQGVLIANQSVLNVKTPLFNAQLFNKMAVYSLPFIIAIVALISLYEGGFYLRNLVGTIISGLIVVYFIHFIMLSGFNTKK